MDSIYVGSDNLLKVQSLKNEQTDSYVNDATVVATLKDRAFNAVTGAVDIPFSYQAGSNGNYHGTLQDTVSLTEGALYYIDGTATSGSTVLRFVIPVTAQYYNG